MRCVTQLQLQFFLVHVLVLVEVLETPIIGIPSTSIEVVCVAAQVWSLTQFYSVDFSQSRIGVKKCVFNKRAIKVFVSCF